jgi:hypothetical protein
MLRRQQQRLLWEWFNLSAELRRKYDGSFAAFVRAVKCGSEPLINDRILEMKNTFCVDRKERSK